jgi:Holliday junction DNA helicase RuvA
MAVREDSVDLYGFIDARELESFRLLVSVNGVGPRVALAILSDNTPDSLALALASGDAKTLTRSAGVGNKLAQRIVLELKDKLGGFDRADGSMQNLSAALEDSAIGEAAAALTSLGYTASEAATALMGSDPSLSVDALIRSGLKKLSAKR